MVPLLRRCFLFQGTEWGWDGGLVMMYAPYAYMVFKVHKK
jgi:hypothetical protein